MYAIRQQVANLLPHEQGPALAYARTWEEAVQKRDELHASGRQNVYISGDEEEAATEAPQVELRENEIMVAGLRFSGHTLQDELLFLADTPDAKLAARAARMWKRNPMTRSVKVEFQSANLWRDIDPDAKDSYSVVVNYQMPQVA